MALTLEDIKDRLKGLDEVTLLEVLDISSEEIVERFVDFIENRIELLEEELQDEESDQD
jgi:hypothetical protein